MKPAVCIVLTSPFVLNAFLLGHIKHLSNTYQITVCLNTRESSIPIRLPPDIELVSMPILRQIAVFRDARALVQLVRFFRSRRFNLVHSITPKGGLLGMVAARIAGVPCRLHFFGGQVWATRKGIMRILLVTADRVIACCATHLLTDCMSQRNFLIEQRVVAPTKISVLANGSISGVDVFRFRPDELARAKVRGNLGIPENHLVILYAGRIKREKGIPELLKAFALLKAEYPDIDLLLVGPDEDGLLRTLPPATRLHVVEYTTEVETYMAAADIFCLPSHREGFGTTLIEAAACGLPTLASRIYGISDAVVENVTGLLHESGDIQDLARKLESLLTDVELRKRLGRAGLLRAYRDFRADQVMAALSDYYHRILSQTAASA